MQLLVKEVTEILSQLFPRARCRKSLIVVPGPTEKEEFRFRFEEDSISLEYRANGPANSQQHWEKIAGTPQEVAKRIIAAIKEMPQDYRDSFERYQKQQKELAAAA